MSTSLSKTPAPKKDKIYGSKVNPKGSASSEKSAKSIKLSGDIIVALTNKLKEFKEKHPNSKNIGIADLKAVYRRGLGAYSTSHRPNITRNAWAMARVNKFLLKAGGTKVKAAYVQDDDLLKMHLGGDMSKHLAGNGKPSKLTHEQWHLVRTPEFKAWFGDWENDPANASKVVDENGEPLPVYHGSSVDFNLFENKPREIGRRKTSAKGFYFTKDKWSATQYAGSDGFVKSYFLKILNYPSKQDKEVLEYSDIDDYLFDYGKTIDRFGYDGAIDVQGDFIVWNPEQIKLADGTNTTFDGGNPDIRYAKGGEVDDHKETYAKWKSLVNMSKSELEKFYNSEEGKVAGLKPSEAKAQGIDSGRESARWIMKMKDTPVSEWTPQMWKWAKKQISFISRMSGNKGGLYDDKGRKTRKHLSLLIWGNNPEKKNNGGMMDIRMEDTVGRIDDPRLTDISYYNNGGTINKNINFMEQNKFASLPHIDTINNGDKVILHEQVFSGDLEKPKHIGSRYIVCEVMGRGGMTNSLNLKVAKSVGTNAINVGSTISRPISVVLAKGKKYLIEPIANKVSSFKDGGELNPDNKQVKQFFAHDSGNAGGVLVGKRHSEGGIKAINKSTGQPIEMEGGEVVITRGAVSNPKKYSFNGKDMTTREVLSKLNVDGGGVSFAEGGDVPDKINCGCSHMDLGGTTMTPQDFIRMSEKEYEENRLIVGIEKERKDHFYTLAKLNAGAITIEQALKEIAIKEMMLDANYPFGE